MLQIDEALLAASGSSELNEKSTVHRCIPYLWAVQVFQCAKQHTLGFLCYFLMHYTQDQVPDGKIIAKWVYGKLGAGIA
jgi:hypothetical protein